MRPDSRGMMANPRPRMLIANEVAVSGDQRTYVVCGVQRGGTSMVAAVLSALGVDMGHVGLNHEDPEFVSDPRDLDEIIANRNSKAIWGLKLPHIALSLDSFAGRMRQPVFVLVFRNPVAILDSALVRGDANMTDALHRIETYFQAMLRFAQRSEHPVVLVSYERASADPVRFVKEAIPALHLSPTPDQEQEAVQCVTGDGGGYTHLPRHWHHVDVGPATKKRRLSPVRRIQERFLDINLVGSFMASGWHEAIFHVDVDPDAPDSGRWVQLLVDFGSGFDMLNTYNLHYPRGAAIHFRHEGSVSRVGFGFRPSHARIELVSVETPGRSGRRVPAGLR